jgi:hypothetical protein
LLQMRIHLSEAETLANAEPKGLSKGQSGLRSP